MTQLKNSVSVDIHRQYTTLGIHKDDVLFHLNHQAIKKFGSQGQQKSFLIALKFALLNYLKQHTQKTPILILDDIFDKLDQERVQSMILLISEHHKGQIFISDTERGRMEKILKKGSLDYTIFELARENQHG